MNNTNSTVVPAFVPNAGDTAFLFSSTALVFIMICGLAFFYGGLVNRKNVVSTIMQNMATLVVVLLQWWFVGYTFTFSPEGNPIVGNFKYIMFIDAEIFYTAHPSAPTIPNLLFATFQAMFAAITPALITGALAERVRFRTYLIFVFLWTTLVYDFIAHWMWSPMGWLHQLGVLDLAGGAAVHTASGMSGLVFALLLKSRNGYYTIWITLKKKIMQKLHGKKDNETVEPPTEKFVRAPNNVPYVVLGTALLWFGWMGFNSGSAYTAGQLSTYALVNTNLSGASGALTWLIIDWVITGRPTAVAFCVGSVVGLVTATPGACYVYPGIAVLGGVTGAIICYSAVKLKARLMDDSYDVFACHGIGGAWGLIYTGIFATKDLINYAKAAPIAGGYSGGWWSGNWIQLPIQLAAIGSVFAWSVVITTILYVALNNCPGLGWNVDPREEDMGLDRVEHGELGHILSKEDEESLSLYLREADSAGLARMLIRLREKLHEKTLKSRKRRQKTGDEIIPEVVIHAGNENEIELNELATQHRRQQDEQPNEEPSDPVQVAIEGEPAIEFVHVQPAIENDPDQVDNDPSEPAN